MKYIKNTTDFYISEETAVSLGKFDGIHRGHECLLRYLKEKKKDGLLSLVFTFDIPPARGIGAGEPVKEITTKEEKLSLFEKHGVDYVLECPFTPEIRHMEPEDFVDMLARRLNVKSIAVGTDFRYGYNRRGDYRLLQELSSIYGYKVMVMDKVKEGGTDISSTRVREEIAAGRIERANELLGYRYFMQGVVAHGNAMGGAVLGVPTANLVIPEEKLLPPFGVYATRTTICGQEKQYFGITNVGAKPTVSGNNPVGAETHLFNFEGDIYGQVIKVEFDTMERTEQKFSSLEALKRQLLQDIQFGVNYYTNVTEIC